MKCYFISVEKLKLFKKTLEKHYKFLDNLSNFYKYQWRSQGGRGKLPPPRNPGKFAKDGEQSRPQPAIIIDSSKKL